MSLTYASLDWMPERRRALRVDVPPRRADLVRADGGLPVTLREISESGLLMEAEAPIRPDTSCDVTLVVAGRAPLTLTGRVVHSRTAGVAGRDPQVRYVTALALDGVGAEEREVLRALVQALADDDGAPAPRPAYAEPGWPS